MLVNLLKIKFSSIAEPLMEKMEKATSEQLLLWSERVLSAENIDDVFD